MSSTGYAPLVDLANVEEGQRAAVWARSASALFPGVSLVKPPVQPVVGSIQSTSLGAGRLWTILSPQTHVSYTPSSSFEPVPMFALSLQLEGSTITTQNRRVCRMQEGDFCLVDGLAPFEVEVPGPHSRVMILKMPRHAVLSRHPGLDDRTAETFSPSEPGAALLREVLLNLLDSAPYLDEMQRASALAAIVQMVGVARRPAAGALINSTQRRIQSTLAHIDTHLADTALNAHRVAESQGLSRRRLDQILLENAGTSLSAQIWMRRLTQAASDLLDPRFATKTVTQIAFSVGFEDAAHFTRAFKRRYQCTPREWRLGGRVTPPPQPETYRGAAPVR